MSISYWILLASLLVISNIRFFVLRRQALSTGHQPLSLTASEDEMSVMSTSTDGGEEMDIDVGDVLHTWPAWSKGLLYFIFIYPKLLLDVFKGWASFLKLGAATTLSLITEWGSFELNAAIAARISSVALNGHAIFCNVTSIWYSFPLDLATACTALVGSILWKHSKKWRYKD
jgi:hypothetical protein